MSDPQLTAAVPALQTQALTLSFGSHVVVDHLDLTVQATRACGSLRHE
jgi:ABC-type transporter Mla maintaining outer membrane lipid asymmetry ATPase subunit MlaF